MTTTTQTSHLETLGPDSLSARYWGDVRMLAVASRALTLQVAHPVVGAGVLEHSDFVADPWSRLQRTLDTVTPLIYGTPERSRALGPTLLRAHRRINGVDAAGRAYRASDPEAWFWVHATLFDAVLTASATFGPRIPERHLGRLYDEFVVAADRLCCDPDLVPPTLDAFFAFRDRMIAERLEHNEATKDVARVLAGPTPPPRLPEALTRAWPVAWAPVGHVLRVTHRALLPAELRRRWGIEVTPAQRAEFRAVVAAVRAGFAVVPRSARELPQVRRERARTAAALAGQT